MSTRPLAVLSACVLALAAIGAYGCGDDTSEPDDDNPSAASADKDSKADASKSGGSESEESESEETESAGSPTPEGVTFGIKSASGTAAIAQAEGVIDNPEIIRLRVVTEPPQTATVSYTLICTTGGKSGGDSGQFTETTPIDREIEIPGAKPTECNVSSNAQIEFDSEGKVTMKLRGRER